MSAPGIYHQSNNSRIYKALVKETCRSPGNKRTAFKDYHNKMGNTRTRSYYYYYFLIGHPKIFHFTHPRRINENRHARQSVSGISLSRNNNSRDSIRSGTGNQVWPIRICIVLLRKQLIRDTEAPALFLLHTPTEYNYSLLRLIAITRILGFDYFHVTEDSILIHRM